MGEKRGNRNYRYEHPSSRGVVSSIKQAGVDILDGGQKKRLDDSYNFGVKESRLRDGIRAVGPLAGLFGILGVASPMVWQAGMEIVSETVTQIPTPGTMNWVECIVGAAGGLLLGAIINAEHSRRVGREWYSQSENTLEDIRRRMSRLL